VNLVARSGCAEPCFRGARKKRGALNPTDSKVQMAALQLDLPAQQFQEVTDVWVPFDESIAIGWE
jgi:hypothetical protein